MKNIRPNSAYAWLLAARPKTLTAALIPVLLGSGLAFSDGKFQTAEAVLCLLFACLMQVAANFINDLFDYQKGTDREDRLGPKRACAEGWITPRSMKAGIGATLLLACACGLSVVYLTWEELPHGGWELVVVGVVCLLFAFLYTTFLSYRGWGDLLVLVFFGLIPLLRAFLALVIVVGWLVSRNVQRLLAAYIITVVVFTYISALIFYDYEALVNPDLHGFGNALWWAWMNVTTVGASIFPVTAVGKIFSVLLPVMGMMFFPIFTTYILHEYASAERRDSDV